MGTLAESISASTTVNLSINATTKETKKFILQGGAYMGMRMRLPPSTRQAVWRYVQTWGQDSSYKPRI